MKTKIIILAGSLLALISIGFWGFDQLGGNNPISISKVDTNPEHLTGLTFSGIPQDEKLGGIFEEIQTQKSMYPGTSIHTIYVVEPAGKLDTMIVFVGINQPLPLKGWESKSFGEKSYLVAKIRGSKWVMPGPDAVKQSLEKYAKANKLKLNGIYIDKIISINEVHVIAPIQN